MRFRAAWLALLLLAGCADGDSSQESTVGEPEAGATDTAEAEAADSSSTGVSAADQAEEAVEPVVFPLTITDAVGRELTLDEPAKIGCFWSGCTEIHASLGIPPGAATVPAGTPEDGVFYFPVGPPDFTVAAFNDLEAWAGADINFVINRGPQGPNDAAVEQFVDIFYLHAPGLTDTSLTGYEAHIANIRMVGQLLAAPEEAEVAVARLETAIRTLAEFSTPELAARSFAYLFNGEEYRVMTDDTPFCAAIAEAAVATCLPLSEGELNGEAFLELDPDVIAVQAGFNDVGYTTETRDDPVWGRLSAVQNGSAYDSDDRLYWCCGSRSLIWALQDFAAYAIPGSGIPAPGPIGTFDPETSPLVQQG
ncbi:MAG: ABC transporter substrate-binding protein [Actinomycetota bacterium]